VERHGIHDGAVAIEQIGSKRSGGQAQFHDGFQSPPKF
jgi:hypothetical protein